MNFYDESGNPATAPLDFPQGGPAVNVSNYTQTIKPGAVAIMESQGGTTLSVGLAQLLTDGRVSGFLIFRYLPSVQEAAVELQVQNSSTYTLPFDNTSGIATGVALSATSTSSTTVQIVVQDDKGTPGTSETITLPARGHLSFVLGSRYTAAASIRGDPVPTRFRLAGEHRRHSCFANRRIHHHPADRELKPQTLERAKPLH